MVMEGCNSSRRYMDMDPTSCKSEGGRRVIKIVIHDEEDIDVLLELARRLSE